MQYTVYLLLVVKGKMQSFIDNKECLSICGWHILQMLEVALGRI